ncbi:thiamine-binding protein [Ekhidna sp.]
MTEKDIHLGIQVVPLDHSKDTYAVIDEAIKVIEQSGLKYMVTPMETVIQGPYEEVNKIAKRAQEALANAGCKEFLVNIKMHIRIDDDVTMEEKRLDR